MTVFHHKILLLLVGIMILASCSSLVEKYLPAQKPTQNVGEQLLVNGIKSYEDGEYNSAVRNLQDAINAGLSRKIDSAKAHKYLAFIACGSNNTRRCNDEFRKAFEDDPNFALDAAEAGHPVWGPVYRGIRDQMKSKEKPR
jgi:Tfp pilus assembly protein PilF